MSPSLSSVRSNKRVMVALAAAIYAGAAFDGVIEGLLPGDPSYSLTPVLVALVLVPFLLLVGARVPRAHGWDCWDPWASG